MPESRPWYLAAPSSEHSLAPVELREDQRLDDPATPDPAEPIPTVMAPAPASSPVTPPPPAPLPFTAPPIAPPPAATTPPSTDLTGSAPPVAPGEDRSRRGRAIRPLLIAGAVVAGVAAVTGAVFVSQALHARASPPSAAAAPAVTVAPSAQAAPPTDDAVASPIASAGPAFDTPLGRSGLKALLLTSADVGTSGVHVQDGVSASYVSLRSYLQGYQGTTDPQACANARGLMSFTDTDRAGAPGWTAPTILKTSDLRLLGSPETGSQQIRQFSSEGDAIAFMQSQVEWFAECSTVDFLWKGSTRSVTYTGQIFQQDGTDSILAIGDDEGLSSGNGPEFDGWVRQGAVVYAAYLLGGADVSSADVQEAGRSVIDAERSKLADAARR